MSDGPQVSRRQVLITGGIAATVPLLHKSGTAPSLVRRPDVAGAPPPEQLHVQYGADASGQAAVSWAAPARVHRPRLRLGHRHDKFGFGSEVHAEERTYTEALTGETVFTYHARLDHLQPDTAYSYEVLNDGADPVSGGFRTAPRGRSKGFRFTSFGDQSIPRRSAGDLVRGRLTPASSSTPSTSSTRCSTC